MLCTGTAVLGMPFWVFLGSTRVGLEKKCRFLIAGGWISIFLVLTAILVRKDDVALLMILTGLAGFGMGGYFATPEAMKPDVVDYDEFITGKRHESRYMGVWMCVANIMAGFGLQLTFLSLKACGYDGRKAPGEQPYIALLFVRILYGGIICITGIIMTILLYFYPITRIKHQQILLATQCRLRGEWATDPLYGGPPLPPYEFLKQKNGQIYYDSKSLPAVTDVTHSYQNSNSEPFPFF